MIGTLTSSSEKFEPVQGKLLAKIRLGHWASLHSVVNSRDNRLGRPTYLGGGRGFISAMSS